MNIDLLNSTFISDPEIFYVKSKHAKGINEAQFEILLNPKAKNVK